MSEDTIKVTDPVCGMQFRLAKAVTQSVYRGTRYYFCTEACCKQFEADPDRYLRATTTEA